LNCPAFLFVGKPIALHTTSALCATSGSSLTDADFHKPKKGVIYVSRELWLDRWEYVGLGGTCCFGGNRRGGQEDI
jgi:hypothetical protein